MGVGVGLYLYVVVVQKFTFAISSPDEFLLANVNVSLFAVARPSVVCLSVTLARPTQLSLIEIFGNISTALGGHPLTSTENFTEIVIVPWGTPPSGELNTTGA